MYVYAEDRGCARRDFSQTVFPRERSGRLTGISLFFFKFFFFTIAVYRAEKKKANNSDSDDNNATIGTI